MLNKIKINALVRKHEVKKVTSQASIDDLTYLYNLVQTTSSSDDIKVIGAASSALLGLLPKSKIVLNKLHQVVTTLKNATPASRDPNLIPWITDICKFMPMLPIEILPYWNEGLKKDLTQILHPIKNIVTSRWLPRLYSSNTSIDTNLSYVDTSYSSIDLKWASANEIISEPQLKYIASVSSYVAQLAYMYKIPAVQREAKMYQNIISSLDKADQEYITARLLNPVKRAQNTIETYRQYVIEKYSVHNNHIRLNNFLLKQNTKLVTYSSSTGLAESDPIIPIKQ